MISEARRLIASKQLANVEVRVQNGEDLNLPPESFDAVLCVDVLHHIPDIKGAVVNFHRVLKPSGRLFALEPNTLNPLIFLAHLIPPEERLAVKRNYAPLLQRLFAPHFQNIKIHFVNFVTSASSETQLKKVESVGRLMSAVPLLRPLSLRQLLIMDKRA
jgi:ubiquinone/menaquinone biosynthesis C-methylase UbiE